MENELTNATQPLKKKRRWSRLLPPMPMSVAKDLARIHKVKPDSILQRYRKNINSITRINAKDKHLKFLQQALAMIYVYQSKYDSKNQSVIGQLITNIQKGKTYEQYIEETFGKADVPEGWEPNIEDDSDDSTMY